MGLKLLYYYHRFNSKARGLSAIGRAIHSYVLKTMRSKREVQQYDSRKIVSLERGPNDDEGARSDCCLWNYDRWMFLYVDFRGSDSLIKAGALKL